MRKECMTCILKPICPHIFKVYYEETGICILKQAVVKALDLEKPKETDGSAGTSE